MAMTLFPPSCYDHGVYGSTGAGDLPYGTINQSPDRTDESTTLHKRLSSLALQG